MAIDIKNVSKSFVTKDKDFMALKDVNLHVDDGELICLLGPSGCGKTTLLRMVAGLEEPDEGEIYDRGELVEKPAFILLSTARPPNKTSPLHTENFPTIPRLRWWRNSSALQRNFSTVIIR